MPMSRLSPEQQPDSHIVPAEYESPCAICHRPIRPGDEIIHSWRPHALSAHSLCTTQEELKSITKTIRAEFSVWPGLIYYSDEDECWYRVVATRYPGYHPPEKHKNGQEQDNDQEQITSVCFLRPATDSEIAATQEKFYRQSRRAEIRARRTEIARLIREQGEPVENWIPTRNRKLEQREPHDGYSYFTIDGEYAIYVKSTGRDGHAPENVEIAWRIEVNEESKQDLDELTKAFFA